MAFWLEGRRRDQMRAPAYAAQREVVVDQVDSTPLYTPASISITSPLTVPVTCSNG